MKKQLATAIELRSKGLFKEANRLFIDLFQNNPDNAEINYHFAWLHDKMGLEKQAVPYYERAISLGLHKNDLQGAMLGLGSTYRTLGEYSKAFSILSRGIENFPSANEFKIFLAMTHYNLGEPTKAIELLLQILASTTRDEGILRYKDSIIYYSDKLDKKWA